MARMQNAITSHELPLKKGQTVKLVQLAFVDCVCQSWLTAAFWFWPFGKYKCITQCFRSKDSIFQVQSEFWVSMLF